MTVAESSGWKTGFFLSTNYAQKMVKISLVEIFDQKRMFLINYVMYEYVYVSNVERDSNSNIVNTTNISQ